MNSILVLRRLAVVACFAALVLVIGGVAQAETILVVSDSELPGVNPTGDHEDDELVSMLQSFGYTVDTYGMNKTMQGTWDATDTAHANAANLVVVSRRTSSGSYNPPAQWNELGRPLLLMSGYLTRSSRWGWTTGSSANAAAAEDTMILEDVHPFAAQVQVFDWDDPASTPNHLAPEYRCPKSVYLPNAGELVSAAELVATFDGRPFLFDLPAGTDLGGSFGVIGARRGFMGHWGYDGGEADYRADDFLSAAGVSVLEQTVVELIPEPATWVALLSAAAMGLVASVRRRRKS